MERLPHACLAHVRLVLPRALGGSATCQAAFPGCRPRQRQWGRKAPAGQAIACNNHTVLGRHRICWVTYLEEIIKILNNMTKQKVSCGEMNVTNIFAITEFSAATSSVNIPQNRLCARFVLKKETLDILCKAATVVENGRRCQPYKFHLESIYVNLRHLIQKVSCPVKADNTIKLKHFLEHLKDFSQGIMKENYR